jgi:hypothetical protein
MPMAFAGAALAVVVYLEQQKPTASFKMDLKPEKKETKACCMGKDQVPAEEPEKTEVSREMLPVSLTSCC